MSNSIKLSKVSTATAPLNAVDIINLIQNGVNKKITLSDFLANLISNNDIRLNSIQNAIDVIISASTDFNAIRVNGVTGFVGIGVANPLSKLHINGNVKLGSTSDDGVLLQSSETIQYTTLDQTNATVKTLASSRATSILNCDIGVSGLFSLGIGFEGQIKNVVMNTLDVGRNSSLTFTGVNATSITFNATGQSTQLQYITSISKWAVLSVNGAVLA